MGAILATPGKSSRHEVRIEKNNNTQNNESKNDDKNQQQQHQQQQQQQTNNNTKPPFNKFNIVQECFPSLTGKENKFFNEKVPSYWSKTKHEAKKKSKHKIIPTALHVSNVGNHNNDDNVANNQPTDVANAAVIIADVSESTTTKPKETTLAKISPLSAHKHYYGTLNLSETLKYIGCYVYLRCRNLEGLKPSIVVGWVRGVDRNLVLSGWQEIGFISQPNMIVLYMLLREVIPAKVRSTTQLKAIMMSTLYMCYAYNGHEISYPLKPFLFDGDRANFWNRCMEIINLHSDKLLRANKDPKFYNEIQVELKTFGRSLERKDR